MSSLKPNPPIPPDLNQYGPTAITDPSVLDCPDLATYWKTTRRYPRVWDPTKSLRAWFAFQGKDANGEPIPWSPSSPAFETLGLVLNEGNPVQDPFTVDAADAGFPNVMELGEFESYAQYAGGEEPTNSYIQPTLPGDTTPIPISPELLFTTAQVAAMVTKVAADNPGQTVTASPITFTGAGAWVYTDSRMAYMINIEGQSYPMGSDSVDTGLFKQACELGVGYPGTFVFIPANTETGAPATLNWVASVPNLGQPTAPALPWPTRPLVQPPHNPYETLVLLEFGSVIGIDKTWKNKHLKWVLKTK